MPRRPDPSRRGGVALRATLGVIALGLAVAALGDPGPRAAATVTAVPVGADTIGIAPDVATVRSGGNWSAGGDAGGYRLIIVERGFEHIASRLYLQWLLPTPDGEVPRVRGTVAFGVLNEMPVYSLDIAAWRPLRSGLRVELSAYNVHSGRNCRFVVEAAAPGVAKLTKRQGKGGGGCD